MNKLQQAIRLLSVADESDDLKIAHEMFETDTPERSESLGSLLKEFLKRARLRGYSRAHILGALFMNAIAFSEALVKVDVEGVNLGQEEEETPSESESLQFKYCYDKHGCVAVTDGVNVAQFGDKLDADSSVIENWKHFLYATPDDLKESGIDENTEWKPLTEYR